MAQLRLIWIGLCFALITTSSAHAYPIGYLETFALAKDRDKALKGLIPNTSSYFYYHALHYQNEGKLDKVDALIKAWRTRKGSSKALVEIEHRQALLRYAQSPKKTLAYLREKLKIRFDAQPPATPTAKTSRPSLYAPKQLRATLQTSAYQAARSTGNSSYLHRTQLFRLASPAWPSALLRSYLRSLERPDHPQLAALVHKDLQDTRGGFRFGKLAIHKKMLLSQLQQLLALRPAMQPPLRQQAAFLQTYLKKLRPSNDAGGLTHEATRDAYLAQLWGFVKTLPPALGGLQHHVLYHLLLRDRQRNRYNLQRFLRYLKLPRAAPYTNPSYLQRPGLQQHRIKRRRIYSRWTSLSYFSNHKGLVQDTLEALLLRGVKASTFAPYLRASYLRKVQLEVMLLRGKDVKRWRKMLSPRRYKRLKERVELRFAANNKQYYMPGETIRIGVIMKRTPTLLIKVYRINSKHYHRNADKRDKALLKLDSLVANRERRRRYRDNPMRRKTRWYRFPRLRKRGIYAIDFLGNGKVIRSIIHVGRLSAAQHLTATGHRFTIFDERGRQLKSASVWLGEQEYKPDSAGHIYLPMTRKPGTKKVYLQHEGFVSPYAFDQKSESYRLNVGFYVDREALLKGQIATLLYRPKLNVSGIPTSVSLLSHARLQIKATDRFGVETLKTIVGPKLYDRKESLYKFRVPAALATLTFTLRARVYNVSKRTSQTLVSSKRIHINKIDQSSALATWHLRKVPGAYILSLRDKSGQGLARRLANIKLNLREVKRSHEVRLQTNAQGIITLRGIQGLTGLSVHGGGAYNNWSWEGAYASQPGVLNGTTATTFAIPYSGEATKALRTEWSLLERRGGTYVRDAFDTLSIQSKYLRIAGLKAGDYELFNKATLDKTLLRITAAHAGSTSKKSTQASDGWSSGRHRVIGAPEAPRPHITGLRQTNKRLVLEIAHPSASTRVHVLATRFVPLFDVYQALKGRADDTRRPSPLRLPSSTYEHARQISQELQYILARKYRKKYPGNMLQRPGLLLQPWAPARHALRFKQGIGLGGVGTGGRGYGGGGGYGYGKRKRVYGRGGFGSYQPNLDYMRHPSRLMANLRPDAQGKISIPRSLAAHHPHIHVLLLDDKQSAYQEYTLPDSPLKLRDIRMSNTLPPKRHFAQKLTIKRLKRGQRHTIKPQQFARFAVIDSLAKAYALLQTQNNTKTMQAFRFVTQWPRLSQADKEKYYSRFASHELHFFLYRKDRAFFRKVVKPYLQNKLHKTFMDRWLLGADLSQYWRPWRFARLNVVEKILLGRRFPRKMKALRRHLQEQLAAKKRKLSYEHKLLMTALESGRLDLASLATVSAKHEVHRHGSAERQNDAPKGVQESPDYNQSPAKIKAYKRLLSAIASPLTARQKQHIRQLLKLHQERERRQNAYQPVAPIREFAETHYFHRPLAHNTAALITINPFWRDVAFHRSGDFLSKHLAYASRHFTEMMMALSFLDLPFTSKGTKARHTRQHIKLRAGGKALVYIAQLERAKAPKVQSQLLVRQRCYRVGHRMTRINGVLRIGPAPKRYEIHTRIGCEIVLTNPEAMPVTLDLLLQIPKGSLPLKGTKRTHSKRIRLAAYRSFQHKYFFTFTTPGRYSHFPVHVSHQGKLLAYAPATPFVVIKRLKKVDKTSWYYTATRGSAAQVLAMMKQRNLHELNLSLLRWRMKRRGFFLRAIRILQSRHFYHKALWSYGILHNHKPTIRTYLQRQKNFVEACGKALKSPLLTIAPQAQRTYQHLEYVPIINARAHRYEARRTIDFGELAGQYDSLLEVFRYKQKLDAKDRLALTYYLLLQDRVAEALTHFRQVRPKALATKLQYDYFRVYLAMYQSRYSLAKTIAERYQRYPVLRWRKLFAIALAHLREASASRGPTSRASRAQQAAHAEASFDVELEGSSIRLEHQHIKTFRINYHVMDVELLFSRNPFVQKQSGPFAMLVPRLSQRVKASDKGRTRHRLPWRLRRQNVIVEVIGAGVRKVRHYHANALRVQVLRKMGQVRVLHRKGRRPLRKVYVKVYAKNKKGKVRFFKDGYTDLRGRFDYASLRAHALDSVKRFAILIASPRHGASIHYALPPNH